MIAVGRHRIDAPPLAALCRQKGSAGAASAAKTQRRWLNQQVLRARPSKSQNSKFNHSALRGWTLRWNSITYHFGCLEGDITYQFVGGPPSSRGVPQRRRFNEWIGDLLAERGLDLPRTKEFFTSTETASDSHFKRST
jgi:hypothetical protein